MFDFATLLPPNATDQTRALEVIMAEREIGLERAIETLWNPWTCPERHLPWLAWALSVDEWDASWPVETKRAVIASSIEVHRKKGTVSLIRRALAAAGYGGAVILEGRYSNAHDGSLRFDGTEAYGGPDHWAEFLPHNGAFSYDASEDHGGPDHWAEYRVRLPRPISIAQSKTLRRILANVAPARCRLKRLYFTEVAHLFDRAIAHDGTYSYGAA
ncbi:phage tail protein I [Paracoccus jiaweipingae]|uniref:phage tail protein I n=1 Tax=Paracoccus sp. p2-l61 TaxID=3366950 RepID=UPI0037B77B7E